MAVISLAGQWGPEGLEFPDGRHARDTEVLVLDGANGVATLYTDRARTGVAPNPTRSDSLGNLSFYAEPGGYKLRVFGVDIPITVMESPGERSEMEAAIFAADTGIPLVLYKGTNGVLGYAPQAPMGPRWGDEIRYASGPPGVSEIAPGGAVHVDVLSWRYYRYMEV